MLWQSLFLPDQAGSCFQSQQITLAWNASERNLHFTRRNLSFGSNDAWEGNRGWLAKSLEQYQKFIPFQTISRMHQPTPSHPPQNKNATWCFVRGVLKLIKNFLDSSLGLQKWELRRLKPIWNHFETFPHFEVGWIRRFFVFFSSPLKWSNIGSYPPGRNRDLWNKFQILDIPYSSCQSRWNRNKSNLSVFHAVPVKLMMFPTHCSKD